MHKGSVKIYHDGFKFVYSGRKHTFYFPKENPRLLRIIRYFYSHREYKVRPFIGVVIEKMG